MCVCVYIYIYTHIYIYICIKQLLKLPKLAFLVMVHNLSVGESACLRCEDDDVLPVGMKALRHKAWTTETTVICCSSYSGI